MLAIWSKMAYSKARGPVRKLASLPTSLYFAEEIRKEEFYCPNSSDVIGSCACCFVLEIDPGKKKMQLYLGDDFGMP